MASIQPSADYTDRDLASLRTRLRTLIKSVFSNWTDFSVANFGNVLADLLAWSGDIMGFTQDAQAAEGFIPTAVQRRSLLRLSALVGYKPVGAGAASTVETFTATGLTANCVIPAGTVVSTLSTTNPIEFQTLSPITLTVAAPSASVTVENSTTEAESFTASGQPNFSLPLGNTPYLDGSLSLTTAQGLFVEVASFVNSGPSDKVFTVKVDDNDRATVTFGDGVTAGLIPTGTISATYKTGGGAVGNASANSIQQISLPLADIHGALVQCEVNNVTPATGGTDREGTDSIRQNAPASLTAPAVSVARTDFEVHAKEIAGIDRALYITTNEDVLIPANTGNLYLVSPGVSGADYPDLNHIDQVRRQFTGDDSDVIPFPMMATQVLGVFPAPFLDIDIVATVYLRKTAVPATASAAIRAALALFFATKIPGSDGTLAANPNIDFGYYLRINSSALAPVGVLAASDIENAIHDVDGVREIGPNPGDLTLTATRRVQGFSDYVTQVAGRQDILVEHGDPTSAYPASANFPRLGSVTLINGDTLSPF